MNELDFTIEFNSDIEAEDTELFLEADRRLRELAKDHDDLTGAAINVRQPAHGITPPLFEVTVVVYARPENIVATQKSPDLMATMKGALDAIERQTRQKRTRLREHWKRPSGHPVIKEAAEVAAAEGEIVPTSEEAESEAKDAN
jgi:ribosome-associated translation inhibitor RaiA